VKGHYTGKDQKIQHNLKVCLLYQKSMITSRLYSVLSKELHDNLLQKYVLKKTKWEVATFNKVDWDAHESAFNRLPRCLTITTAKLIHNLANTNRQKILYYKSCALCPGCQAEEETFEHILKCSFPSTAKFWQEQLLELHTALENHCTPPAVCAALLHGFRDWIDPPTVCYHTPTSGSLRGPDILLTEAYYEQFHQLSWFQLCLGRVSKNGTMQSKPITHPPLRIRLSIGHPP